ncbi:MAG: DUF3727 domain-containing protein [Microcystaceae cyanobacterium]
MSSFPINPDSDPDEIESVILSDEEGRTLECYIENALDAKDGTYLLLMPMDTSVVIIESKKQGKEELPKIVEDFTQIEQLLPDAKAVLAELDLFLQFTAFTLTVQGELPPIEDDGILTINLEEDRSNSELEPEELQFLASFYHNQQKYSVCTPLAPLLFLAKANLFDQLEIISPDDDNIQPILEELLFDDELD